MSTSNVEWLRPCAVAVSLILVRWGRWVRCLVKRVAASASRGRAQAARRDAS